MAEEPQPSNVHEGAGGPEATPANAEDRKAAAAMDSLDTRGEDEGKRDVNTEALGQAMKNISGAGEKKVEEKRAVKVDPADVNLLVSRNTTHDWKRRVMTEANWIATGRPT